jgi:DNA polymerase I
VAAETGEVAEQLRSVQGVADCLEDDIRAAMRYLLDNNLSPCGWHEGDVESEDKTSEVRVSKVYVAKWPPKRLENVSVPDLRVMAFSTIYYSREGTPKSDRNPVLLLSTVDSNGEEKQFTAETGPDDKPVIEAFTQYVAEFDPDIIVSFGANTVHWTYLRGRSHTLGLHLDFDRAKLEPHTGMYGHVSLSGIVNLDLADFMDVFPEVKVRYWNQVNHLVCIRNTDITRCRITDDTEVRQIEALRDGARKSWISGLLRFCNAAPGLTSATDQALLPLQDCIEWF